MGRKKLWADVMQCRFPKGTFMAIASVRAKDEDRTDFGREAVERELDRRGPSSSCGRASELCSAGAGALVRIATGGRGARLPGQFQTARRGRLKQPC